MSGRRSEPEDLLHAAAVGAAAGLFASFAMNLFQRGWSKVADTAGHEEEGGGAEEPTTTRAADKASEWATGRPLHGRARALADPLVHYGLGAVLGAAYAVAARFEPRITAGYGTAYGGAVALVLDEGALPLLGLAPPPQEIPVSTHAYAGASHLVFGLALEWMRGLLSDDED
jgi:hypothetical protein